MGGGGLKDLFNGNGCGRRVGGKFDGPSITKRRRTQLHHHPTNFWALPPYMGPLPCRGTLGTILDPPVPPLPLQEEHPGREVRPLRLALAPGLGRGLSSSAACCTSAAVVYGMAARNVERHGEQLGSGRT